MADEKCFFSGKAYSESDVWYPQIPTEDSICVKCNCLQRVRRERAAARGWLTRSSNNLATLIGKPEVDKLELEDAIDEFDKRLNKLDEVQAILELEIEEDMMCKEIEEAGAYRETSRSSHIKGTKILAEIIDKLLARECSVKSSQMSTQINVKLPTIELPKFSGIAGKIDCSPKQCPDDCFSDNADKECCTICQENLNNNEQKTKAVSEISLDGKQDRKIPCMHNGIQYEDGQGFTSNSTGLTAQRADQCVQCVCKRGLVLCRLKTCPKVSCSTPVESLDNCCPVCQGDNQQSSVSSEEDGDLMVLEDVEEENEEDSKFSVTFYPSKANNGKKKKGQYYLFGRIECQRVSCKPKHKLPCAKPVLLSGTCCHVCPSPGQFGYFATQLLTKSDFLMLSSTFNFQVLGATEKKYTEKFVKRAKRLQKKCTNKCHRRMERLQRNLKLKPVVTREKICHDNEVSLPNN
ncbi:Chordin-like protein 1 [Nymphon striatum]|nr:Chordin-like protein 1 [Nymphon striatum]